LLPAPARCGNNYLLPTLAALFMKSESEKCGVRMRQKLEISALAAL